MLAEGGSPPYYSAVLGLAAVTFAATTAPLRGQVRVAP